VNVTTRRRRQRYETSAQRASARPLEEADGVTASSRGELEGRAISRRSFEFVDPSSAARYAPIHHAVRNGIEKSMARGPADSRRRLASRFRRSFTGRLVGSGSTRGSLVWRRSKRRHVVLERIMEVTRRSPPIPRECSTTQSRGQVVATNQDNGRWSRSRRSSRRRTAPLRLDFGPSAGRGRSRFDCTTVRSAVTTSVDAWSVATLSLVIVRVMTPAIARCRGKRTYWVARSWRRRSNATRRQFTIRAIRRDPGDVASSNVCSLVYAVCRSENSDDVTIEDTST